MATTNNQKELTATYIDAAGNKQTGTVGAGAAGNTGVGATGSNTKYYATGGEPDSQQAQLNALAADPANQQTASEVAAYQNAAETAAPAGTNEGTEKKSKKKADYWTEMADYYQQMYDEQVAANNAANAAAAEQARQATQAQIEALAARYADTNRQLYRDYMQNERTLPQQMAAQGYSGGLSESAMLRLRNAYEENMNVNERARSGEENAANAALAQQIFEAQMAADQANQQANQQRLSYLAQLETSQYEQEQKQLQQRAKTLAAAGDYTGYLDLGYSQKQVDYLTRIWLSEHPDQVSNWIKSHPKTAKRLGVKAPSYSSGSNTYRSGPTGPTEPEKDYSQDAVDLIKKGTSLSTIDSSLKASVNKGEMTQAQANKAMTAATAAFYSKR